MFFRSLRCYIAVAIASLASFSPAYGQMKLSGNQCFDNAIVEAQQGGDLPTLIQRYLNVTNIAATAAWNKWRIRWSNLEETKREQALRGVRTALRNVGNDFFDDINFDTFTARSEGIRGGERVWGSYRGLSNNTRSTFELFVAPDCRVFHVVYSGISLSRYVGNRL